MKKGIGKLMFNLCQVLLVVLSASSLFGCKDTSSFGNINVTDSLGNTISFDSKPERVVVLEESLTHTWTLSGGTFVGTTDDYKENNRVELNGATTLGKTKEPNIDLAIGLYPDLIIYTTKNKQKDYVEAKRDALKALGCKFYIANIDNFNDYLYTLHQFCIINDTEDTNYVIYGLNVQSEINEIINKVNKTSPISIMFMRARNGGYDIYSSGNFVCDILDDLNCINIAYDENGGKVGLDQPISRELAIVRNPKFCFITYMGASTQEKIDLIDEQINNSVFKNEWIEAGLDETCTIVRLTNRSLFQYKPNDKWAEAYKYLYNIIYGQEE